MKHTALILLPALLLASQAFASPVTNVVDSFETTQVISTNNATETNTIAASSIGGYRTLVLGATGTSPLFGQTTFGVDGVNRQLALSTPRGVSTFQVIWGGAGGTSGLGGIALGGNQPLDLLTSALSFSLAFTDQPSNFSWRFTDTAANTATYSGSFPAHTLPSVLPYSIPLGSFVNAAGIDWNAIDFIVFSGGDVATLDMTLEAPIQVVATTVPEPSSFVLLATSLAVTALVLRRRTKSNR